MAGEITLVEMVLVDSLDILHRKNQNDIMVSEVCEGQWIRGSFSYHSP